MNQRELEIKAKLEAEGWVVLRGGAPDFIALRTDGNGRITEFKSVEIKSRQNGLKLSYEQEVYREIFKLANIKFEVAVI